MWTNFNNSFAVTFVNILQKDAIGLIFTTSSQNNLPNYLAKVEYSTVQLTARGYSM